MLYKVQQMQLIVLQDIPKGEQIDVYVQRVQSYQVGSHLWINYVSFSHLLTDGYNVAEYGFHPGQII